MSVVAVALAVPAALLMQGCELPADAATPQTIWAPTARPAVAAADDFGSVELGTRFFSDVAGTVTGVRFYRGATMTGVHDGRLWNNNGQVMATVRFTNETASGWQQANFATPVAIVAGRPYVISYHAPSGQYAYTSNYFATNHATAGPLHEWVEGTNGLHSGVYHYASGAAFPDSTFNATNYWVDAVFLAGTTPPPSTTTPPPPTTSTTPAPTTTTSTTRPPTTTTSTTRPPTTTTSTTAPPTGTGKNCAPNPHLCGYPDATNTGLPAGTVLRRVPQDLTSGPGWVWDTRGWLSVNGNGAVLDSISTTSGIVVQADNVTIKRVKVAASTNGQTAADHSSVGIKVNNGSDNTVIQDSEIFGAGVQGNRLEAGIQFQYDVFDGTVTRTNIYHVATAVQANGGTISDSYFHDFGFMDWGPSSTGPDHLNGITSNAGGGLLVRHNTILQDHEQTDAVSMFQDFGTQANNTIDDNILAGGGYCIYGGEGGQGPTSNIKITRNRISRMFFANGGQYGWLAHYTSSDPGNVTTGNVWDDTNQPVN